MFSDLLPRDILSPGKKMIDTVRVGVIDRRNPRGFQVSGYTWPGDIHRLYYMLITAWRKIFAQF